MMRSTARLPLSLAFADCPGCTINCIGWPILLIGAFPYASRGLDVPQLWRAQLCQSLCMLQVLSPQVRKPIDLISYVASMQHLLFFLITSCSLRVLQE